MTHVSPIEGHRLWAPVYDSDPNPVLELEHRSMLPLLSALRPALALDVACGTGRWLSSLVRTSSHALGIDACPEMLSQASRKPRLRGRLMLADAAAIPCRSRAANLVLCSMALGYLPDLSRVFDEFYRIAAPGALLAVSDLHPDAIAAGWTRSFKLAGEHYELKHYSPSLPEIESAATRSGFRPRLFKQLSFGVPELPLFRRAGKESIFRSVSLLPVIFIAFWEKPC
jgi:ubiquinone/menaquinone biosynthesis C-methylase UbiE